MIRTQTYSIHEIAPYINWSYFFHAWNFPARFAAISHIHGCDVCRAGWLTGFPEKDRLQATEAMQLFKEAQRMLAPWDEDFRGYARFGLYTGNADGDDLVLYEPEHPATPFRLSFLRQQSNPADENVPCLCLTDFVRPLSQGIPDTVGLFAATVDPEMEHLYEEGAYADDFKHLLAQTLADRLAEAAAEKMHQEVRKTFWGYAPDEQLTIGELHAEKHVGIRPAVGYPSLPDQSLNFDLARQLDFSAIGIKLTENGAMIPHASVSGLMIAHPKAHYFSIGKIGEDQLKDYASRKGISPDEIRKYLCGNL